MQMVNDAVVGKFAIAGSGAAAYVNAGDLQVNGSAIVQMECGTDTAVRDIAARDATGAFKVQGLNGVILVSHNKFLLDFWCQGGYNIKAP
jgi:hypothetical protein